MSKTRIDLYNEACRYLRKNAPDVKGGTTYYLYYDSGTGEYCAAKGGAMIGGTGKYDEDHPQLIPCGLYFHDRDEIFNLSCITYQFDEKYGSDALWEMCAELRCALCCKE